VHSAKDEFDRQSDLHVVGRNLDHLQVNACTLYVDDRDDRGGFGVGKKKSKV
jgi:hypothetical protein